MEPKLQRRPRGRPKSLFKTPRNDTVQALDRGISVLEVLSGDDALSLSDLAQRVELPSSTTHRLLATLQKRGFVEFDESLQSWSIGIEVFRIGSRYIAQTNLVDAARNIMRQLMEHCGETANLGICQGGDVIFISQKETSNPIRAFFQAGSRSHMHASGIGKALLADMKRDDVEKIMQNKGLPEFTPNTITSVERLFEDLELSRKRGWAYDNEERYTGMRCIAAGIYNEHGEVIAGISISGPTIRLPENLIEKFGPMVADAAEEVTRIMGGKIRSRK